MGTVIFGIATFVIGVIVGININRWSKQPKVKRTVFIWGLQ
jgi:hypothetical protein